MAPSLIDKLTCPVCEKQVPELTRELEAQLRDKIVAAIREKKPNWTLESGACTPCLNYFQNLVGRPGRFRQLRDRLRQSIARKHHG